MIAGPGLRWALTGLFAVIALHGLFSVLRPADGRTDRPVTDVVGNLLHTVMAVAMAVMVWPVGMDVPVMPQVLLFAAAALWFLTLAVLPHHPGGAVPGAGPAQARLPCVLHAAMAGAMAWMVNAMAGSMTESTRHSAAGHEGHHMAGGPMTTTLSDGTSRALATALALGFAPAAWWWLARAFDTARATDRDSAGAPAAATSYGRHGAFQFACHGGMGAGMTVMLLAMA